MASSTSRPSAGPVSWKLRLSAVRRAETSCLETSATRVSAPGSPASACRTACTETPGICWASSSQRSSEASETGRSCVRWSRNLRTIVPAGPISCDNLTETIRPSVTMKRTLPCASMSSETVVRTKPWPRYSSTSARRAASICESGTWCCARPRVAAFNASGGKAVAPMMLTDWTGISALGNAPSGPVAPKLGRPAPRLGGVTGVICVSGDCCGTLGKDVGSGFCASCANAGAAAITTPESPKGNAQTGDNPRNTHSPCSAAKPFPQSLHSEHIISLLKPS